MFSALKRWTKMSSEESKLSMPSGVKAMGQALQRKFARGVQYNMKIIIKGDRNTGKTCMFHRLQGKPFNEQYIPTNEIQAGSIHWSYKAADDIVKVDVWDIVDVGKSRKPSDSLKIENNTPTDAGDDVVADANFLDVYKGTHGVIMVMDITKPWTFQYIRRELPKVPAHIPVLVLGSHRDMEEHRLIDQEEVTNFIQNLERPDRSPPIHYAESSMKNGFGLKYIHTFLNFPFLLLQREALLQQLQVNAMDMESTLEELQLYKHTEEQDYYKYLDFLEEKKKEREKKQKAEAEAQKAANDETKNDENASLSSASPPQTNKEKQAARKDSQGGGMRRWFSGSKPNITNDEVVPKQQPKQQTSSNAAVTPSNIEEFKPEEELDAGFLDEESSTKEKSNVKNKQKQVEMAKTPSESSDESDSESGPVNPMVASFAEDISDDETVTNGNIQSEDMAEKLDVKLRPAVTDVHITSSEEEEEEDKEETIEVLKPEVLKPTPLTTSKNKTKGTGLKMDIKGSLGTARIEQKEKKRDMVDDIDDWLDSPDPEPKISYGLPKEIDYTVTKVDINKSIESPPPAPVSMDEWSLFMAQQMSINEKKSKKSKSRELLHDSDKEQANESRHHKKKDHKSGEKSRSKKHKKHKEKNEENEVEKERRKSKHKETEKEKQKPEDNEKKKRSKHKPSKKKSVETSGNPEGQTYEEL